MLQKKEGERIVWSLSQHPRNDCGSRGGLVQPNGRGSQAPPVELSERMEKK
jgi:hypothetical protein